MRTLIERSGLSAQFPFHRATASKTRRSSPRLVCARGVAMPNTPLLTPGLLVAQHGRTIPLTERVLGHHLTLCIEDQQGVYSARDEEPQAWRTYAARTAGVS